VTTAAGELAGLWEPLELGTTVIRNRVMVGPTTLLYARDNLLSDRHIAFYTERARGGAGLIVTEEQGAYRFGVGAFEASCTAWSDAAVPQLEKLANAVHSHGAKVFAQLYAAGIADRGSIGVDWRPVWGPSLVADPEIRELPLVMGEVEIQELIEGFAHSASNVARAGLDGVELHAAHGWLLGQFLSPLYNHRQDGYGGSVAGRCRLTLEIAHAIRERCDLTLGLQLSFDEYCGDAGITPDDADAQLGLFAASGLFDYVNVSTGSQLSVHMTIPTMEVAEGFLAEHGTRAKAIVGDRMKVALAGRIRTLRAAAALLAGGHADLVAMTRAHFADPFLVRKGREGREAEIVPCIGENECILRAFSDRPVTCLMNPAMGRERRWHVGSLRRTSGALRVLVAGGGPAGLKLAAVAAERGHHVTLFEAATRFGGHLDLLRRLPGRSGWREAIDALVRAAERSGVEICSGETLDRDAALRRSPDVVVCATGSHWSRDGASLTRPDRGPVPGCESAHVLDIATAAERALADPRTLGAAVVIVDESGEHLPLGLADVLSAAGVRVEIVTSAAVVGQNALTMLDAPHVLGRLAARDVELSAGYLLERVEGDAVELAQVWSGRPARRAAVDSVVLSMGRVPDDRLFTSLCGLVADLRRVGDALAPRRTVEVIYEAEKVGREL
jgi:2,4-dienoyl-CoA reductase-like NADH-dependent reductase (Old Yellow Enzyme family)